VVTAHYLKEISKLLLPFVDKEPTEHRATNCISHGNHDYERKISITNFFLKKPFHFLFILILVISLFIASHFLFIVILIVLQLLVEDDQSKDIEEERKNVH